MIAVAHTAIAAAVSLGLHKFQSSFPSADSWKGTQEKEEDPYASGGWGNNSWGKSPQPSAAAPRQVSMPELFSMLASLHLFTAVSLLFYAKYMLYAHCIDFR